jgi:hypothetical protein
LLLLLIKNFKFESWHADIPRFFLPVYHS